MITQTEQYIYKLIYKYNEQVMEINISQLREAFRQECEAKETELGKPVYPMDDIYSNIYLRKGTDFFTFAFINKTIYIKKEWVIEAYAENMETEKYRNSPVTGIVDSLLPQPEDTAIKTITMPTTEAESDLSSNTSGIDW